MRTQRTRWLLAFDGLNDDWEFRELLGTSYSGADDPDGDGQSNAQEFAQKTDPLP